MPIGLVKDIIWAKKSSSYSRVYGYHCIVFD